MCARVLNPVDSAFTFMTIMDAIYHHATRMLGSAHVAWLTEVRGMGGGAAAEPLTDAHHI